MNKYSEALLFSPIATGENAGKWESGQIYQFHENDDMTGAVIIVSEGAISNGADIPPPWVIFILMLALSALFSWLLFELRIMTMIWIATSVALTTAWLLPRVHAEYIEAVFVHDIGLEFHRHLSRALIDRMFLRALRVTTTERLTPNVGRGFWRAIRPYVIYFGVAGFGLVKERHRYFKPLEPTQSKTLDSTPS